MIKITGLHFDTSLDDLDLHSRLQLYEKSKTFMCILFASSSIDLDEIHHVATMCWLTEAHAKFVSHD